MQLSPHFTLAELTTSQTAARQGLINAPNAGQIANLKRLCTDLLEPIRALVGKPVNITSGFRSPAVNTAVSGATNSAHMSGLAADINVNGLTPKQLCQKIRDSSIHFDQLILEFDGWAHVALRAGTLRREVLTIRADGKGYQVGIV